MRVPQSLPTFTIGFRSTSDARRAQTARGESLILFAIWGVESPGSELSEITARIAPFRESITGPRLGMGESVTRECVPIASNGGASNPLSRRAVIGWIPLASKGGKDLVDSPERGFRRQDKAAERIEMHRAVVNLIAAVEGSDCGYTDMPPDSINDEIESQLAVYGYAVALSDRLWIGGYRVHSPESVHAGNYRPHIPPSNFTCIASRSTHVPDARDFDLGAILEERGAIPSN